MPDRTLQVQSRNAARNRADAVMFRRFVETRDPLLRAELIERFVPLARTVAMRFRRGTDPVEDIVQVACLGLVKAVDRFDPERGTVFSTFAVPTISGEVRRYFRDHAWSVRPPRSLSELALRVEYAADRLTEARGEVPTVAVIAEHLGDHRGGHRRSARGLRGDDRRLAGRAPVR